MGDNFYELILCVILNIKLIHKKNFLHFYPYIQLT